MLLKELYTRTLFVAGKLVQELTVCVTLIVPAVVSVMEAVVAPVLHNNEPV